MAWQSLADIRTHTHKYIQNKSGICMKSEFPIHKHKAMNEVHTNSTHTHCSLTHSPLGNKQVLPKFKHFFIQLSASFSPSLFFRSQMQESTRNKQIEREKRSISKPNKMRPWAMAATAALAEAAQQYRYTFSSSSSQQNEQISIKNMCFFWFAHLLRH